MNHGTQSMKRRKRRGQGATEYIIILVLVAIGSIAVITVFGDQMRALYEGAINRLGGDTTTPIQTFDPSDKVNVKIDDF